MPNWCSNRLEINGPTDDVTKFIRTVGSARKRQTHLSLDKSYPCPPALYETEEWYDWCIDHWGIKWDVKAEKPDLLTINLNENTQKIEYYFDSAWSPPSKWLERMSNKFKTLKFSLEYREEGLEFQGTIEATNGDIVDIQEEFIPNEED